MVKKKEEIIESLKEIFGENATNDNCLTVIEDITDTISDFETKASDTTDWHQKYVDNDKEWRNKYLLRFSEGGSGKETIAPETEKHEETEEETPTKFEELFTDERSK